MTVTNKTSSATLLILGIELQPNESREYLEKDLMFKYLSVHSNIGSCTIYTDCGGLRIIRNFGKLVAKESNEDILVFSIDG